MLVMGRICNENFHPFELTSGMTSQENWMFATGKLAKKSNQIFLRFDRVYDLHFRIQTNFGQISSTQL